jgi:predicted glycoside hydrolase/deacetylase ChbG (UPF0249 family)
MQLIINADDFGLTSGVNRGIIDCHLAGSVTSTTLLVNMPAADEAAQLARLHPALGVGLHFNLTLGAPSAPVDEVRSLVDGQGLFHRRSVAERMAISGRFVPLEVERELLAQFHRFKALGLTPTHIDSHQHIHLFPGLFDVVAGFCAVHDLPLRLTWVGKQRGGVRRRLRAWLLGRLVRRNAIKWGGQVRMNAGFGSVFDRVSTPEEINLATYRGILSDNPGSPFELMVHPAVVDAELAGLTRISGFSAREYGVLSDRRFTEMLGDVGCRLITYGTI